MRKEKFTSKCNCYPFLIVVILLLCSSVHTSKAQEVSNLPPRFEEGNWSDVRIDVSNLQSIQYLSRRISLRLNNVTLRKVLTAISSLAEVNFSYSEDAVPIDKVVSVNLESVTLAEALNEVLVNTNLSWVAMEGNHIVITEKQDTQQGSGTVKGKVFDAESKEALPGATVLIRGTSIGASTDLNGEYVIHGAPVGEHTIIVSYVGYVSSAVRVLIIKDETTNQNFYLRPTAIQGQEVTITAQAQGQLGAINQQLSSNTIENVVSRARIQEFPDVNAAESIGRLPGVSIERSGGEATKVEIRGLDPKYSLVTVNGVNLPATSTTDRSVDLSLIPSNMLDGITLKKVVTPDMDPDVLGGTVDLQLKEAPKGSQFNASAQGGYNALQKYYQNYNFEGSGSNRFFSDRLGVIASVHADNYDRSADKFQDSWFPWAATGGIVTGELQLREEKVNKKRAGASLLVDYVIPNGKVKADGFFNQLTANGLYHLNIIWTPSAPYNTDRHWYQLEQSNSKTNVFTSAVGIAQDFNWIRYDFGASRSGSLFSNPNDRVWQFDQEAAALDSNYHPTDPPTKIAQSTYIDSSNTRLANIYIYGTRLIENQTSMHGNFEIPFRIGDQLGYIKAGGELRWIDRSNTQSQVGNGGLQYGNSSGSINAAFAYLDKQFPSWNLASTIKQYGGLPITPFLTNYSRSNFLNGEYPLGLVYDEGKMNQMTDALIKAPDSLRVWLPYSIGSFGNNYDGIERYEDAYLMGEFNFGGYLTLLAGVRWEAEYTRYHGQRFAQVQSGQAPEQPPAGFTRLTTERKNSFLLPDVNLIVKPVNWLQVKLARTQTLARPDYIEYAPISYVSADQSYIQAANTQLKTSRSTNYDAAVSVFSNTIGLFSVDGFYKDVKDLVFYSTYTLKGGLKPDSSLNIPPSWYQGASPQVSTYMNNPNPATYYGFEVEWQTNFWYLPSILHGLVLDINYTHMFSQMKLQYDSLISSTSGYPPRVKYSFDTTSITTRMPDQPSDIFNLTIGYDLGGFSLRASYLYQTDKLTGIGYIGTVPSPILSSYTGPYARWDITLQQKLTKNVVVFLNLNNLNNRPDQNFTGSTLKDPSYIEYYGFTMDVGVRVTL